MSNRRQPWTTAQLAELKALAASGLSGRQIGERMGFTRNAVLGQAHRSGINLTGKAPPRPKKPRPEREMADGRRGQRIGWRNPRKGMYYHPRDQIIQCLALHLAGVSQIKAAKAFGFSNVSVSKNWMRDPALLAEAKPLAERALAEARDACRRRQEAEDARKVAEQAEIDRFNELVYLTLKPREAAICRAYTTARNMSRVGEQFGVCRERIRQIIQKAESKGFIPPTDRVVSHRGYQSRSAA